MKSSLNVQGGRPTLESPWTSLELQAGSGNPALVVSVQRTLGRRGRRCGIGLYALDAREAGGGSRSSSHVAIESGSVHITGQPDHRARRSQSGLATSEAFTWESGTHSSA